MTFGDKICGPFRPISAWRGLLYSFNVQVIEFACSMERIEGVGFSALDGRKSPDSVPDGYVLVFGMGSCWKLYCATSRGKEYEPSSFLGESVIWSVKSLVLYAVVQLFQFDCEIGEYLARGNACNIFHGYEVG